MDGYPLQYSNNRAIFCGGVQKWGGYPEIIHFTFSDFPSYQPASRVSGISTGAPVDFSLSGSLHDSLLYFLYGITIEEAKFNQLELVDNHGVS